MVRTCTSLLWSYASSFLWQAAPIYLMNRNTYWACFLQYFIPYIKKRPPLTQAKKYMLDEACSYSKTPVRCVVSLRKLIQIVKRKLPSVHTPIYNGQGLKDRVVRHRSAYYIHHRVSSQTKAIRLFDYISHGILLDQERDPVFGDIIEFISSLEQQRAEELLPNKERWVLANR